MLHQRLQKDTIKIIRLKLSIVLLMNDSSFPWLILVPEREDIREIYELGIEDRSLLIEEITDVSEIIRQLYSPDKINIGALGNIVPQLHIHVIGRFITDRAWPGPVWGTGVARPYESAELDTVSRRLMEAFELKDRLHGR